MELNTTEVDLKYENKTSWETSDSNENIHPQGSWMDQGIGVENQCHDTWTLLL